MPDTWVKKRIEGDGDFITHYDNSVKDDSVTIINILELLKHAVFVDANKSCDSDDCGE